ncbi:MAG: hypothetical protein ABW138_11240, partial [Candidatus Thiodiazotropha sp. 4PDIVS1]
MDLKTIQAQYSTYPFDPQPQPYSHYTSARLAYFFVSVHFKKPTNYASKSDRRGLSANFSFQSL